MIEDNIRTRGDITIIRFTGTLRQPLHDDVRFQRAVREVEKPEAKIILEFFDFAYEGRRAFHEYCSGLIFDLVMAGLQETLPLGQPSESGAEENHAPPAPQSRASTRVVLCTNYEELHKHWKMVGWARVFPTFEELEAAVAYLQRLQVDVNAAPHPRATTALATLKDWLP